MRKSLKTLLIIGLRIFVFQNCALEKDFFLNITDPNPWYRLCFEYKKLKLCMILCWEIVGIFSEYPMQRTIMIN